MPRGRQGSPGPGESTRKVAAEEQLNKNQKAFDERASAANEDNIKNFVRQRAAEFNHSNVLNKMNKFTLGQLKLLFTHYDKETGANNPYLDPDLKFVGYPSWGNTIKNAPSRLWRTFSAGRRTRRNKRNKRKAGRTRRS